MNDGNEGTRFSIKSVMTIVQSESSTNLSDVCCSLLGGKGHVQQSASDSVGPHVTWGHSPHSKGMDEQPIPFPKAHLMRMSAPTCIVDENSQRIYTEVSENLQARQIAALLVLCFHVRISSVSWPFSYLEAIENFCWTSRSGKSSPPLNEGRH